MLHAARRQLPASRGRAAADVPGHYDKLAGLYLGAATYAVDGEVMVTETSNTALEQSVYSAEYIYRVLCIVRVAGWLSSQTMLSPSM